MAKISRTIRFFFVTVKSAVLQLKLQVLAEPFAHLAGKAIKRHLELMVTTISCSAGAISVGTGDGAALMAMAI